ncbi:hypothetical protein O0L34_g19234 [Tuta absoluta]|nr:hypothetical protein O0L34_g19234 [Tuta absoluta]
MFALPRISQPSTSHPESPASPSDQGAAPVPELNSEPSPRSGTPHPAGTSYSDDDHENNLPRPDTPPFDDDYRDNPATTDNPTVSKSPTTTNKSPESTRQFERSSKSRFLALLSDDSNSSANLDGSRKKKLACPNRKPIIDSDNDQSAALVPKLNSEPGSSRSGTPHRPGTPDFPDDLEANLPRPDTPPFDVDFPENPATPDNPTVPNSPTTPVKSPESNRQCERPFKRRSLILKSDDSDSSANSNVPRNKKQAHPTKRPKIYDSDDESIFD